MSRPACSRRCGRPATMTARTIGGGDVPMCTRCAGSVLLDLADRSGAIVRVIVRGRRAREGGRFVPRPPAGGDVR